MLESIHQLGHLQKQRNTFSGRFPHKQASWVHKTVTTLPDRALLAVPEFELVLEISPFLVLFCFSP